MVKTIYAPEVAEGHFQVAIVSETVTSDDIIHSSERPIKGKFWKIGKIAGKDVFRIEKDEKSKNWIIISENYVIDPILIETGGIQFDYELTSINSELSDQKKLREDTMVTIFVIGDKAVITNMNRENKDNLKMEHGICMKYENGLFVNADIYAIFGNGDFGFKINENEEITYSEPIEKKEKTTSKK